MDSGKMGKAMEEYIQTTQDALGDADKTFFDWDRIAEQTKRLTVHKFRCSFVSNFTTQEKRNLAATAIKHE
jgi:hypothetical protein